MKDNKNQKGKIFAIIAIFIINALGFMNSVYAIRQINSAYIQSIGVCGQLIKYKEEIVSHNGVSYLEYCIDETKIK